MRRGGDGTSQRSSPGKGCPEGRRPRRGRRIESRRLGARPWPPPGAMRSD